MEVSVRKALELASVSMAILSIITHMELVHSDQNNIQQKKPEQELRGDLPFDVNLKRLHIPEHYRLPEIVIGDEKAPLTLIVYSSFTCAHCRRFHLEELAKFKKKCVDTGQVKIYLRSYLDDLASLEAAILTRCIAQNDVEMVCDISRQLYEHQDDWFASNNPKQFLRDLFINEILPKHAERLKIKPEKYGEFIDKCLADIKISAGLMLYQQEAFAKYDVKAIPTFIILNGNNTTISTGGISADMLEELCLKESQRQEQHN